MDGNMEQAKQKSLLLLSFSVSILGALLLISAFFLPFGTANEDYTVFLLHSPDAMYVETINMKFSDAINISLLEFAKIYFAAFDTQQIMGIAISAFVIILIFAFFTVMTALFVVLNKPIATIIFTFLSFAAFSLIKWDFTARGILPGSNYDWGIASPICYFGIITLFIGSVLSLICKIKKHRNAALCSDQTEVNQL